MTEGAAGYIFTVDETFSWRHGPSTMDHEHGPRWGVIIGAPGSMSWKPTEKKKEWNFSKYFFLTM
jgi:hypothetical protein